MRPVVQIAVGDELLCGRTVDTNSPWLQRRLLRLGLAVGRVSVVPDSADAIAAALDAAPPQALVVVTGGLGPTPDDLTVAAVAGWAGRSLVEDPETLERLRRRARQSGRTFGPHLARQARLPEGFSALANPLGTAPAVVGEAAGRLVVLLPGVPAEVRGLWPAVAAWLRERGSVAQEASVLRLRTVGLSEPELGRRTEPLRAAHPGPAWSWWLSRWGVDLQVVLPPEGTGAGDELAARLREACGPHLYAVDGEDLPEVVLAALRRRGWTLAAAESCTGGLVAAAVTDVPGASDVFRGGVVAYANAVKEGLLGVPAALLAREGAVSRGVAEAMAAGARRACGADVAVAVTGIAGPGGGSPEKPVGTTWFAVASPQGTWSLRRRFPAGRERNRQLAAATALAGVWRHAATGDAPWPGWPEE